MTNLQILDKLEEERNHLKAFAREIEKEGWTITDEALEAVEFIYEACHKLDNAQRTIYAKVIENARND